MTCLKHRFRLRTYESFLILCFSGKNTDTETETGYATMGLQNGD